ncbi:MAG: GTP 3',8-cyclase MoaA [Bacteroidia bacterium]|nr:GTP 3',8-cyclase MoaA [Bacteroidia bacterium]
MLIDNHGRTINYLRLAVTDRCNLRCAYCMPEHGALFAKRDALLSLEELKRVSSIMVDMGISKIRITGGEPFVRKDIMPLLAHLSELKGLEEISITTNATGIGPHIEDLKRYGIRNINVSLDAIRPETFKKITKRDTFQYVYDNLVHLITEGFNARINFVVLEDQNIEDIYALMELQERFPIGVRFLEEMPFNGTDRNFNTLQWDYKRILEHIQKRYPDFTKIEGPATSTSINYQIPGHKGTFGLIPSFSRTFCGSCNRIRITATGDVITCLYGKPKANLKQLLADNKSDNAVRNLIKDVLGKRAKTGFEAQQQDELAFKRSMTAIGG